MNIRYTSTERSEVLDKIVHYLNECKDVISIILVGSGASGFCDELSDIDFTVVLNDNADIDSFLSKYQNYLNETYDMLINHRVWGRPLAISMLNNFLEIDISAVYLAQLCAVRDSWKVISDKTGQVEAIMQNTWNSRKLASSSEQIEKEFKVAAWGFWHYLIYSIIAIKRNDLWRAYWEMQYVRDLAIKLIGFKQGVETKRNRDIKLFPTEIQKQLCNTIPGEFTKEEFLRVLKELITLIYDILEGHLGDNAMEFPRHKMKEYFNSVFDEM